MADDQRCVCCGGVIDDGSGSSGSSGGERAASGCSPGALRLTREVSVRPHAGTRGSCVWYLSSTHLPRPDLSSTVETHRNAGVNLDRSCAQLTICRARHSRRDPVSKAAFCARLVWPRRHGRPLLATVGRYGGTATHSACVLRDGIAEQKIQRTWPHRAKAARSHGSILISVMIDPR